MKLWGILSPVILGKSSFYLFHNVLQYILKKNEKKKTRTRTRAQLAGRVPASPEQSPVFTPTSQTHTKYSHYRVKAGLQAHTSSPGYCCGGAKARDTSAEELEQPEEQIKAPIGTGEHCRLHL